MFDQQNKWNSFVPHFIGSDLTEFLRKILKVEDKIYFKSTEVFYKDI